MHLSTFDGVLRSWIAGRSKSANSTFELPEEFAAATTRTTEVPAYTRMADRLAVAAAVVNREPDILSTILTPNWQKWPQVR
jgi:hypothetical protein